MKYILFLVSVLCAPVFGIDQVRWLFDSHDCSVELGKNFFSGEFAIEVAEKGLTKPSEIHEYVDRRAKAKVLGAVAEDAYLEYEAAVYAEQWFGGANFDAFFRKFRWIYPAAFDRSGKPKIVQNLYAILKQRQNISREELHRLQRVFEARFLAASVRALFFKKISEESLAVPAELLDPVLLNSRFKDSIEESCDYHQVAAPKEADMLPYEKFQLFSKLLFTSEVVPHEVKTTLRRQIDFAKNYRIETLPFEKAQVMELLSFYELIGR